VYCACSTIEIKTWDFTKNNNAKVRILCVKSAYVCAVFNERIDEGCCQDGGALTQASLSPVCSATITAQSCVGFGFEFIPHGTCDAHSGRCVRCPSCGAAPECLLDGDCPTNPAQCLVNRCVGSVCVEQNATNGIQCDDGTPAPSAAACFDGVCDGCLTTTESTYCAVSCDSNNNQANFIQRCIGSVSGLPSCQQCVDCSVPTGSCASHPQAFCGDLGVDSCPSGTESVSSSCRPDDALEVRVDHAVNVRSTHRMRSTV